jgi:hypothetical protein
MISGWLPILDQISCRMRYRVFCWSWMSAKVWAPMAYRLLFWRTVHPFLCVHFLFFFDFLFKSLSTCVFPEIWKLSYVTPIFKKSRHNNVEDYRGVAMLSAIPKRFKLLVYRTKYEDSKIWYLLINMASWRTDRLWGIVGVRLFCAKFTWRRMADGFRLHGLFEGFWSSTSSTVTGGDVCGYRTRLMFMAKVLFIRENSKDKNRWRCFQNCKKLSCGINEINFSHKNQQQKYFFSFVLCIWARNLFKFNWVLFFS